MSRLTHQQVLESLFSESEAQTFERPIDRRHAVVIFTPRSGSSWLADLLKSTGVFGAPNEYLNQAFFKSVPFKVRTERDYLSAIELHASSDNKFFCLETTWGEIEQFSTLDFFAFYRDALFFHLRRRDIILQAISLMMASQTGLFHQVGGRPVTIDGQSEEIDFLSIPTLSDLVQQWCSHIAYCEWMTEYSFMLKNIQPTRIFYEDLVSDPIAVTNHMLSAAGLTTDNRISSTYEKLDRPQTEQIRARFEQERPVFISQLAQMRAPLCFAENTLGAADHEVGQTDIGRSIRQIHWIREKLPFLGRPTN